MPWISFGVITREKKNRREENVRIEKVK